MTKTKKTLSFAEFVRALKRAGRRRQVQGYLFAIDKKSGDLCGCALGQGLIESGMVDPEEIREKLLTAGKVYNNIPLFDQNGTTENSNVLVNPELEQEWTAEIQKLYGIDFFNQVSSGNDSKHWNIANIIDMVFNRFGSQLV